MPRRASILKSGGAVFSLNETGKVTTNTSDCFDVPPCTSASRMPEVVIQDGGAFCRIVTALLRAVSTLLLLEKIPSVFFLIYFEI